MKSTTKCRIVTFKNNFLIICVYNNIINNFIMSKFFNSDLSSKFSNTDTLKVKLHHEEEEYLR